MDPLIWRSQHNQFTKEIESLKSQVLNLTERFNIIVGWINSQFYDLIGVPDEVITAIHENSISIPVGPTPEDKNLIQSNGRKSISVTEKNKGTAGLSHNPFIALENLNMLGLQSLAELSEFTNFDALVQSLSELNNKANNTSLTCDVCSKSFNLNIQLKKHKMCHSIPDENKSLRSDRKDSRSSESSNSSSPSYTNILKFEMTSGEIDSEESDSNSLYDPLGDFEKEDDTCSPVNTFGDPIDDCIKKEEVEIEIKEETEEDPLISQCENTSAINSFPSQRPKKKRLIENDLKCQFCSKTYRYETSLKAHEKLHIRSNGTNEMKKTRRSGRIAEYRCKKCSTVLPNKYKYYSHIKNQCKAPRNYTKRETVNQDDLICKLCDKAFPSVSVLGHHERQCCLKVAIVEAESEIDGVEQKMYKCLKCEFLFASKEKYLSHKRDCWKIKRSKCPVSRPVCDICGKSFVNQLVLNEHKKNVHEGERNFLCTECGKTFSRADTLRNHQRTHAGVRNFKCDYCDKTFLVRQSKYIHEKRHLGVLKTTCHICGFSFSCKPNLMKHILGVHENKRLHNCHLCEKSFKTKNNLSYHLKTHENPNARKRGLNKDIDHMKAAAKRRNCTNKNSNIITPFDVSGGNNSKMENVERDMTEKTVSISSN